MNEKLNLQDLSALLSERLAITKKEAETFLREYFEMLNEELLHSGVVKIRDLGTFKLLQVGDRESVDVTTGERVLIPAHYKVTFTPDKKLAEAVNEPFAFFETTEINDDSIPEELATIPEEDASEDSDLNFDEEEENGEQPHYEDNTPKQSARNGEEENPVTEENSSYNQYNSRNYCFNCRDYEAHRVYRKKYFRIRKKMNRMRIIIFILSVLLAVTAGYIIYMTLFDKNILAPIFHKITTEFIPA